MFDDLGVIRHRYVVAANQIGKSQIGVNELRWLLTNTHPTFERPSQWGTEPLLLLAMSRTTQIIEENIWAKLRPFLQESEIKVNRQGGQLKSVTHLPTGNRVMFISHNDVKNAREKAQGFECHWAWVDEMPNSLEFINEIQMRVRNKGGFFLATFTPLIKNDAIRKYVDGLEAPLGRKYQLDFLANPLNLGREKEILESFKGQPYSIIRTRLYGDWSTGEGSVYLYLPELHVRPIPSTYHRSWIHHESIDPASSTKLGYLLWTQDPSTLNWYCIKDDYINGPMAPTAIIEEVKKKTLGLHVPKRIADGHESWFINQAASDGIHYESPLKRNRKTELITGLQEALGKDCFLTPECTNLIDELIGCSWNDDQTAIVSASTYHLLDAAQYFVDLKPMDRSVPVRKETFHERLCRENEEYAVKEARAKKQPMKGRLVRFRGSRGRPQWMQS